MNALSLKLIKLVIWLLWDLIRHQTTKETLPENECVEPKVDRTDDLAAVVFD